jgi:predicted MFS family arabinose efflux permease
VAVIQLAITAGASLGGLLFDTLGWRSTFTLAAVLLIGSSIMSIATWRATRRSR